MRFFEKKKKITRKKNPLAFQIQKIHLTFFRCTKKKGKKKMILEIV